MLATDLLKASQLLNTPVGGSDFYNYAISTSPHLYYRLGDDSAGHIIDNTWSDNFTGTNGDAPDPANWKPVATNHANTINAEIQSNQLNVSMTTAGGSGYADTVVEALNDLPAGDFSVRVKVSNVPNRRGYFAGLWLQAETNGAFLGLGVISINARRITSVYYTGGSYGSSFDVTAADASFGIVRMDRVGTNINLYGIAGSGTEVFIGNVGIGVGATKLALLTVDDGFNTAAPVLSTFDDFEILSAQPTIPTFYAKEEISSIDGTYVSATPSDQQPGLLGTDPDTCVLFDNNGRINLPNGSFSPAQNQAFSIFAIIDLPSLSSSNKMIFNNRQTQGLMFYFDYSTQKITMYFRGSFGTMSVYMNATLVINTRYTVLLTYNGSVNGSGIKFYLDGLVRSSVITSNTLGGGVTYNANRTALGYNRSGTENLGGFGDEFLFWLRELSAGEATQLHNNSLL